MRNITILVPDSCIGGTIGLLAIGEKGEVEIKSSTLDFTKSTVYSFLEQTAPTSPVDNKSTEDIPEEHIDDVEAVETPIETAPICEEELSE